MKTILGILTAVFGVSSGPDGLLIVDDAWVETVCTSLKP